MIKLPSVPAAIFANVIELSVTVVASAANATAMFAVPSKDVPPIVLEVAKAVAVAASPTAIFAVPSKDVPPIVLAVANAVAVAALPVVLPDEPDIDGAVIAPDVIVSTPILIDPNPDVIEPVSNAPTVTNDAFPAVGDLPDKSVVKFKILDCAMAAAALILASAILVIELPAASWSIVLFVNVVVESAVTVE